MLAKFMFRSRAANLLTRTSALFSFLTHNTKNTISTLNLKALNQPKQQLAPVDVAVIGGGSGGLAFCFEATKHGLDTVIFDYVQETPHKTKWGLGGTCVNVGCIPKKLIHQAAILGESIVNSSDYGWQLQINTRDQTTELKKKFNWEFLIKRINSYIKSLNFGYKSALEKAGARYINALATIVDNNTILYSNHRDVIEEFLRTGQLPDKEDQRPYGLVKAKNIVVATGSKPTYFTEKTCKNSKLAITSDDIFWMKKPPGKTLIVGGGYVAVEIAGFLGELGFDVSMMTRGEYLRSFDRDMVNMITKDLKENRHVKFIDTSLPRAIEKNQNNRLTVAIQNQVSREISSEEFDTVLFAVGRTANTEYLNVDRLGIHINSNNNKIKTLGSDIESTNIENVYALGDVVDGVPELTGTVQKAAALLARRIAVKQRKLELSLEQRKNLTMDYRDYPTTIFTPLEYSVCGMSEDEARKKLGTDNVEVYHSKLIPLQESLLDKYNEEGQDTKTRAYMKVITDKQGLVYGLHYAGPNAGEVMQGYAVALRMGLTKAMLDRTVGIHPTVSEEFTNLKITKSSGEDPEKTGC